MSRRSASELEGMRILVVEDVHIIAREIAAIILEAGGEVVGPAPSLLRAMHLLDQHAIDAAVLDIGLADGSPKRLADALVLRGVPMVFATGYEGTPAMDGLPLAPVVGKPFAPEELMRALMSVCGRARA